MDNASWKDGECFYVDAVDGGRVALLAGPFRTLKAAEKHVERAKMLALNCDLKAWFYAYGCSKWANGHRVGRFNKDLGIRA